MLLQLVILQSKNFLFLQDFLLCKREVDRGEHRTVYALGRHPTSEPGVHVHEAHQHFSDNVVITSKVFAISP